MLVNGRSSCSIVFCCFLSSELQVTEKKMAELLDKALRLKNETLSSDFAFYAKLAGLAPNDLVDDSGDGTKTYIIAAAVSDYAESGTASRVTLILNGTKGSSSELTVNWLLSDNLQDGERSVHHFRLPDLGDILTIDIDVISFLIVDKLHLRYLVVAEAGKSVEIFPCYRWISSKITVRTGKATLAFRETQPLLLAQRQNELKERQEEFVWGTDAKYSGFPGYINSESALTVPKDVQFADVDGFSFAGSIAAAGVQFSLAAIGSPNVDNTNFKLFYDTAKGMGTQGDDAKVMEALYNNWTLDKEFGRQYLNGVNPVILQKCTTLPTNFPVQELLTRQGIDISSGKLYIANYAALDGILKQDEGSNRFCCAPICLFHLQPNGDLLPIAIQLNQTAGPTNPIWTPQDSFGWLLAKIFVRNADTQVHQAVTHLFKTHLFLEAITLPMWRQLPEAHPVFKLLLPHTRTTLAINSAAREALINPGGIIDMTLSVGSKGTFEAVRRAFRAFKVQDLNFPESIKARGLDDPNNPPNFYFRDDGIQMWNIIHEYVKEVIGIYYLSDDDIRKDTELQAWNNELYTRGFASDDGSHHGFKSTIDTRNELIVLVTTALFQASAFHAAVNFSQMAYYGFVPNMPNMMRGPPPTSKSGITLERILSTLPNTFDTGIQLATAYTLSRYSLGEIFVGVFPELHFTEEAPNNAAKKFKANLEQLDAKIALRNSHLDTVSYPYLRPSLIPNSIAK